MELTSREFLSHLHAVNVADVALVAFVGFSDSNQGVDKGRRV